MPAGVLGFASPPPIHVETPAFEGSLAMLLQCVRDHKVQLLEVPMMPICEAYFEYLVISNLADLDEAGAALVALAYLLERKAWAMLPVDEPEPVPEEPLELPEASVMTFAPVIEALRTWHDERARRFFRTADAGPEQYELPYTLANVKPDDLAMALERLLKRAVPPSIDAPTKPRRSLGEQMRIVYAALSEQFRSLEQMLEEPFTREDAVYWFLSILELVRLGRVLVRASEESVEFAKKSG